MDAAAEASVRPIEDMLKRLNASAVFGEPMREGDVVLIPVASVAYGFGYGSGSGSQTGEVGSSPSGSGQGGGGGGAARPLGFIRVAADGVSFEAAMNPLSIPLAGIAMVAWSVFWITKAVRAFARRK